MSSVTRTSFLHRLICACLFAWALCCFSPPTQAHAAVAGQKIRLAILELRNEATLPEAQIAYLTDQIRGQASQQLDAGRYLLMTRESIQELLPPGVSLSDCVRNSSCEVEVGRKIGADYIVTGEVLRIDDELRLNLKVYHCGSGAFLGNVRASGLKLKGLEADWASNAKDLFGKIVQHAGPGAGDWASDEGAAGTKDGRIGTAPPAWSPTAQKRGVVRFNSDPAGAMVLADGRVICQTTPCSKALAQGTVSVQMQKERYLVRSEAVLVPEGKDAIDVTWKLAPTFGWLTIDSQPNGLPVTLNGDAIGNTPIMRREMDPGQYEIVIADTLYYRTGERITVAMGQEKRVDLVPTLRMGAIDVTAVDKDGNDLVAEVRIDGVLVGNAPGVFTAAVGRREVVVSTAGREWKTSVVIPERQTVVLQAKFADLSQAESAAQFRPDNVVVRGSLMWTGQDNDRDVDWYEAKAYCEACHDGGYTNWRMPTIQELEGLYSDNIGSQTKNGYSVSIVEPFKLSTPWQWSSTQPGKDAAVYSAFPGRYETSKGSRNLFRVLCVRPVRK